LAFKKFVFDMREDDVIFDESFYLSKEIVNIDFLAEKHEN